GNLWGFAFIADLPDLSIAGQQLPEALDTLDFSAAFGDITVDVYDLDFIRDTIGAICPVCDFSRYASINTNVLIATSGGSAENLSSILGTIGLGGAADFLAQLNRSMVVALDIESLKGPNLGTLRVNLHGNASLRGTVNAGILGNVTLDYTDYNAAPKGVHVK